MVRSYSEIIEHLQKCIKNHNYSNGDRVVRKHLKKAVLELKKADAVFNPEYRHELRQEENNEV